MERRIGALWIAALYAAVSCARGANLDGVGGGGAAAGSGGAPAGSGGSPTSSASSGVGGAPTTAVSSSSAVGSSASSSASVSATVGSSSSSSSASSGVGGSVDAGLDASVDAGGTGFGPCVTQQDIDGQSTQPFEIGFCHNPFACFLCPNNAVNPGDLVCSPNCLCAPLPPLCGSDAGADAPDDASVGPVDAASD